MNTPTKKSIKATELISSLDVNVRQANNYDIPAMKEQIRSAGRVLKPLVIRGEDNVALQGNRRLRAVLEMLSEPDLPSDLKENITKLDCLVYHGLTPAETLTLIADHGGEKPISKTEVAITVMRAAKEMFTEWQIINMLYFSLARYTGNERKLQDVPVKGEERKAFLTKWFHGTVGNYILAASVMGDYVRDQFILTHKSEDRLLLPERVVDGVTLPAEVVEMRCSRERITQLSAAKQRDTRESSWSRENGGPLFNELIEKFKAEDRGETEKKTSTRPSTKDLQNAADQYKSPAIRNALLVAAGHPEFGRGLSEMDDRLTRLNMVMDTLRQASTKIVHQGVKRLVDAILSDRMPAGEVDVCLKPFCETHTYPDKEAWIVEKEAEAASRDRELANGHVESILDEVPEHELNKSQTGTGEVVGSPTTV